MKLSSNDIRLWIALCFLIRLLGITNPPAETTHAWRQVTGTMVARNFHETDANILYPRLDNAGNKTGITGTEFPLLNYLMYLLAKLFGWQDWYGRLINLIVSSAGVWFSYRLISRYLDEKTALYTAIVLLFSSWFIYSRKTMPDTFSTSLVIGALWFGFKYLYQGRWWRLLVFLLLGSAGVLSKIPAGFLFVLFLLPFTDSNISISRKAGIAISGLAIVAITAWWYFDWVPYLVEEYGFWHYYMGSPMDEGLRELLSHPAETLQKFYFAAMHLAGFGLFLLGMVMAFIYRKWQLLSVFALSFSAFAVFMVKAGWAFHHHDYYILPFVPVMALIAGYGLSAIKLRWLQMALLAIFIIDGIATQYNDFFIPERNHYLLTLETLADEVSQPDDLIAISGGEYPIQLYFTHRKGWTIESSRAKDTAYIAELAHSGAKYLFINKEELDEKLPYTLVKETAHYRVYRLAE